MRISRHIPVFPWTRRSSGTDPGGVKTDFPGYLQAPRPGGQVPGLSSPSALNHGLTRWSEIVRQLAASACRADPKPGHLVVTGEPMAGPAHEARSRSSPVPTAEIGVTRARSDRAGAR